MAAGKLLTRGKHRAVVHATRSTPRRNQRPRYKKILSSPSARRAACSQNPSLERWPKPPISDLLTAWRIASKTERTDALAAIRVDEFYAVMPANWRAEMASRVAKPRSADEPFIKASEILRRPMSLMKVTSTASPKVSNAEREALAALRRLNVVLAGEGIDEVTIVRLVHIK